MPLRARHGWRVLGSGVLALGVVALLIGDFLPGEPAPQGLPDRVALAYVAGAVMTASGVGLEVRRTARWAAAAATAYFLLVVAMNVSVALRHPGEYGSYSGVAEPLAVAAGAFMVVVGAAGVSPVLRKRLMGSGQLVFGVCVILFGGAHFAYMSLTAPLVPKWLPPSQAFWGYATGIAQVLAGIAIVARVWDRLAAGLLTAMYAAFTPLVHLPMLVAAPGDHFIWSENALNLALVGAAWVVADACAVRPAGSARFVRRPGPGSAR